MCLLPGVAWSQISVRYVFFISLLGYVDKLGTAYQENSIATGYGAYIARVCFLSFCLLILLILLNSAKPSSYFSSVIVEKLFTCLYNCSKRPGNAWFLPEPKCCMLAQKRFLSCLSCYCHRRYLCSITLSVLHTNVTLTILALFVTD